MEKFNFSYDFRTEGGVCKEQKQSQRKVFGNKDAKIGHFQCFPEI